MSNYVTNDTRKPPVKHRRTSEMHGASRTPEYAVWVSMVARCQNDTHYAYQDYGGRGIRVCEQWRNSFVNFMADMGPRPHGAQIDRINNDGDYSPANCRWSTRSENSDNRRSSRWIEFNGKCLTTAGWARKVGISQNAMYQRLRSKMPLELALTQGLMK